MRLEINNMDKGDMGGVGDLRVSHSGGHRGGGTPSHSTIFFQKTPSKPMPSHWAHPQLKNEDPHLKNKPPLKHEVPFHEMTPRKSTINNNLKSS